MTSVAINFERAGYEAAHALEQLMQKSKRVPLKINAEATHLVARRSTDVVAVDDPAVAKALRFIRDNVRRAMSVTELATAAGISRRALERRFRLKMGRSLLHEMRRARTDEISRVLLETNWPVGRVAESLGFDDAQHFARYFRAGKKLSPLAFRKLRGKPAGN